MVQNARTYDKIIGFSEAFDLQQVHLMQCEISEAVALPQPFLVRATLVCEKSIPVTEDSGFVKAITAACIVPHPATRMSRFGFGRPSGQNNAA